MKKTIAVMSLITTMAMTFSLADGLKNSLTNIMHEKEKSPVVDLGDINLNAKPRVVRKIHKTHSKKAIVATINGHNIRKIEADDYLSQRTQGKVKNFDNLSREQQKHLIEEIALPILVSDAAKHDLTDDEKQSVFSSMWMRKEAVNVAISDAQIMNVYNKLKKDSLEHNATASIPAFDLIKENLRMQIIQRTIIQKLLENVKIEVAK
jgi:hypothetical protein